LYECFERRDINAAIAKWRDQCSERAAEHREIVATPL